MSNILICVCSVATLVVCVCSTTEKLGVTSARIKRSSINRQTVAAWHAWQDPAIERSSWNKKHDQRSSNLRGYTPSIYIVGAAVCFLFPGIVLICIHVRQQHVSNWSHYGPHVEHSNYNAARTEPPQNVTVRQYSIDLPSRVTESVTVPVPVDSRLVPNAPSADEPSAITTPLSDNHSVQRGQPPRDRVTENVTISATDQRRPDPNAPPVDETSLNSGRLTSEGDEPPAYNDVVSSGVYIRPVPNELTTSHIDRAVSTGGHGVSQDDQSVRVGPVFAQIGHDHGSASQVGHCVDQLPTYEAALMLETGSVHFYLPTS